MGQRRMPTGQGPGGGVRPSGATGPRPAAQRGSVRRVPRLDPPARRVAVGPRRDARPEPPGRPGRFGLRAALRRAAGPARRLRAPRVPRRISGRAAVVAVLLIGLALAYAYPVRVYLAQEAQIDALESAQAEQRERIRELTERVARWDDDQYVIAQARSRLQLVRKGEVLYVVGAEPTSTAAGGDGATDPWFHRLWSNVQAADDPAGP